MNEKTHAGAKLCLINVWEDTDKLTMSLSTVYVMMVQQESLHVSAICFLSKDCQENSYCTEAGNAVVDRYGASMEEHLEMLKSHTCIHGLIVCSDLFPCLAQPTPRASYSK